MDMIKFFLKMDFILFRIIKYDDNFSLFFIWKFIFKNIMQEISVIFLEELDVFVSYFGIDLLRQVVIIRKCNVDNLEIVLKLVWERFEE